MQRIIYIDKNDKEWIRCGKCRNKLFKWTGKGRPHNIEIKCHSCKCINTCEKNECATCAHYYQGCCVNFDSDNFSHEVEKSATCEKWEAKIF